MQDLLTTGFLFPNANLLVNSRGFGLHTDIDLALIVEPGLDHPVVWSGILNLVARLAFETVALQFPLVAGIGEAVDKNFRLIIHFRQDDHREPGGYLSITRPDLHTAVLESDCAECLEACLNTMARSPISPSTTGLAVRDAFLGHYRQGTLADCTLNDVPAPSVPRLDPGTHGRLPLETPRRPGAPLDLLRLHRLFHPHRDAQAERDGSLPWEIVSGFLSVEAGIAVSMGLAAWVMEATRLSLPLVSVHADAPREGTRLVLEELRDQEQAFSGGDLSVKRTASSPTREQVHIRGTGVAFKNGFFPWIRLTLCRGGEQFAAAETLRDAVDGMAKRFAREGSGRSTATRDSTPWGTGAGAAPGAAVCHQIDWTPETDDILSLVAGVRKGWGRITCEIYVSKPFGIRHDLQQTVTACLSAKGYDPKVQVFNAFKPGLSRLLEHVLPRLKQTAISRVSIACRPFTGHQSALELEHRWIHELFPAPEILARQLAIPRDRVTLDMDPLQAEVYSVTGLDRGRHPVFRHAFSPFYHQIPYSSAYPDMGNVFPTCSGIRIFQEDRGLLEQAVATDRDRFWQQFQSRVVPDLLSAMRSRLESGPITHETAFFDSIMLDVSIDETDMKLGFMDEQINPMEALQEDLYFFLLNLAQRFSRENDLPDSVKMGGIVPRVRSITGNGRPGASVTARPRCPPLDEEPAGAASLAMACNGLTIGEGGWTLHCSLPANAAAPEGKAAAVPPEDVIETQGFRESIGAARLDLQVTWNDLFPEGRTRTPQPPPASPGDVVIADDRPLPAAEVHQILCQLARHPQIRVWEIARSHQGRPIHAVEALGCWGDLVSVPRLRRARPTVLFNARHHANEVSSTTAVLRFLDFLTGSGRSMLDSANVVCIPLENVDGVAAFESLYVEGRSDMLHVARYNAVGAEFYNEYHKEVPVFTEAWAKKRLWQRWLPEIMADLHGVPGHEWCQPFAGYTPVGFREFWLPRAFVWVHMPFMEEQAHPLHAASLELVDVMRQAIARESDIVSANAAVTSLYEAYARRFEPAEFPPAVAGDLTVLPLLGRARAFNYAVCHPEITRSEVVVEVPDEVAHGKDLALCVKTHFIMQKALAGAVDQRRFAIISTRERSTDQHVFVFN